MRVLVAANRMKHPLDARTLARLAVRYADRGSSASASPTTSGGAWPATSTGPSPSPGDGGLLAAPHGGELSGPGSVRDCLDDLHADADRPRGAGGRGPAAAAAAGRPRGDLRGVPGLQRGAWRLREARGRTAATLYDAGVPMALGADDPLLFGSRLAAQYELAREHHGFTDAELAELARQSVRGSAAPDGRTAEAAGGDRRLARPR